MTTQQYAAQGEWVTIETQELGWVRYLKTPSNEIAEDVARTLNTTSDLLASLKEMLRSFETGEHYETRNPYSRPYVQAALAAITKAEGRTE
jgi:hypothetical protein